jgi:hypothetical protein
LETAGELLSSRPLSKEIEMAQSVLFLGWSRPRQGREAKAMELFNEIIAFWTHHLEQRDVVSILPVFLDPHGGDINGFVLVQGYRPKLDEIRRSDEWEALLARAIYTTESFRVISGLSGEALQRRMGLYARNL